MEASLCGATMRPTAARGCELVCEIRVRADVVGAAPGVFFKDFIRARSPIIQNRAPSSRPENPCLSIIAEQSKPNATPKPSLTAHVAA